MGITKNASEILMFFVGDPSETWLEPNCGGVEGVGGVSRKLCGRFGLLISSAKLSVRFLKRSMNIEDEAIQYAKQHKLVISRRLTDPVLFPPSGSPVTIFMAGSPGAGKTEYSKNLLELVSKDSHHHPVRIDSDELRSEIPGYTGNNSSQVQGAVSILLREMYERTLINKQTVIVDGTFSNYEKAKENITRSLNRQRKVFIFFIYQKPEIAWQFTLAREKIEGRNIPKDVFINQFIQVRETIDRIQKEFEEKISIFLVKKDYQTNQVESVNLIRPNSQELDEHLPDRYTKEQMNELI